MNRIEPTWLVTGSRGYVGRHLISEFERLGFSYIGVDKETRYYRNLNSNCKEFLGDYADSVFMRNLFENHDIKGIVHLAALKDVTEAILHPENYLRHNLAASKQLVSQASLYKVARFIFASSAAVYGDQNTFTGFKESGKLTYSNAYGRSKLEMESYLASRGEHAFRSSVALRFFNIGGAIQGISPDLDGPNLIPLLIRSAMNNQQFTIYGNQFQTKDGSAERDYIHVKDVVNAILASLNFAEFSDGFSNFNIGTGIATSVSQVIASSQKHLGLNFDVKISEPRKGDAYSSFADISKAKEILNWVPKINFQEIIESYSPYI